MSTLNPHSTKQKRQQLRKRATLAEAKLWKYLRKKQFHNLKFRRQFGILRYIVDFCDASSKVVIEVDGDTHATDVAVKKDTIRQKQIENLGYLVLRYTNHQIINAIEEVLTDIQTKLMLQPPPTPSLQRRGGKTSNLVTKT